MEVKSWQRMYDVLLQHVLIMIKMIAVKQMKFVFQNVIVVRLVKNKKQNVELLN